MASIGEELKYERSRKGFSIRDAEQALHIRAAYLEALEENDFKVIPGDVYVKGFLRNYANYLGLDGQAMVDAYKRSIGEDTVLFIRTKKAGKQRVLVSERETQIHRRLTVEGRAQRRKKTLRREQFIVGIFAIFVTIFLVWLFLS